MKLFISSIFLLSTSRVLAQTALETKWGVTVSKTGVQEFTYSMGEGDLQPAKIELFYNNDLPTLNGANSDPVPALALACPSNNGLTSSLGTITAATGTVNTLTGIDTSQTITAASAGVNGESGVISFTFDGNTLANSNAYYLDTPGVSGQATVQFCVRITNLASDSTEVMFSELALQYTLDFDGTITSSNSLVIDAAAQAEGTETTSIGVTSFFCDSLGVILDAAALAVPVVQGDSVYVCVESDSPTLAGVQTIDTLSVSADNGASTITQDVVVSGADTSFSTMTCSNSKCSVEIFLTADFYPSLADSTTLSLSAAGTAELVVGVRRLRRSVSMRNLESTEMVDFETKPVSVNMAQENGSGAHRLVAGASSVAVAVVAMLL